MMTGSGAGADRPLSRAAPGTPVPPDSFWQPIQRVARTGSTNSDLLAAARRGAPEGSVLVADAQTAGRGRIGRGWVTGRGTGLACSVLLRPAAVAPASRGWVPLLAGVAVAGAVRAVAGVQAWLKWPNDVLAGGGKLAGILAEQYGDAIVVGIGMNLTGGEDQRPAPGATSLALQGASCTDRDQLLAGLLIRLGHWYLRWSGRGPQPSASYPGDPVTSGVRAEYLRLSATVGRQVRVELPGGRSVSGTATDIDDAGRLVVAGPAGPAAVSAGDVVHVR
jgi:BirA family transcriptional regulator, biotin operon repressor / biotin---[acetyl-CoA-carboxylase] ligase